MRRFVAILILFVLPMQWSYAAIGSYCLHESTVTAKSHLGHHDHEHAQAKADSSKGGNPGFEDQDCPTCHFSFVSGISVGGTTSAPEASNNPILFQRHLIPDRSPENPYRPPHTAGA